jgi:hypothetical protein
MHSRKTGILLATHQHDFPDHLHRGAHADEVVEALLLRRAHFGHHSRGVALLVEEDTREQAVPARANVAKVFLHRGGIRSRHAILLQYLGVLPKLGVDGASLVASAPL